MALRRFRPLLPFLLLLLFTACGKQPDVLQAFVQLSPARPHEAYARQLRQTGLDRTALGRDWLGRRRPGPARLADRDACPSRKPASSAPTAPRPPPTATPCATAKPSASASRWAPAPMRKVFRRCLRAAPRSWPRPTPVASADTTSLTFSYAVKDSRQPPAAGAARAAARRALHAAHSAHALAGLPGAGQDGGRHR